MLLKGEQLSSNQVNSTSLRNGVVPSLPQRHYCRLQQSLLIRSGLYANNSPSASTIKLNSQVVNSKEDYFSSHVMICRFNFFPKVGRSSLLDFKLLEALFASGYYFINPCIKRFFIVEFLQVEIKENQLCTSPWFKGCIALFI